jgi:hypothetical protein
MFCKQAGTILVGRLLVMERNSEIYRLSSYLLNKFYIGSNRGFVGVAAAVDSGTSNIFISFRTKLMYKNAPLNAI